LKLAVGSAAYVEGKEQEVVPDEVTLTAYPNPISRQATLEYTLPEATDVRIAVYDVLGRRVAVLEDGRQKAGRHTARLDGGRLASGVYFGRLETDGQTRTQKITVVR
jgi:flagellar hook assembly protein FlgD